RPINSAPVPSSRNPAPSSTSSISSITFPATGRCPCKHPLESPVTAAVLRVNPSRSCLNPVRGSVHSRHWRQQQSLRLPSQSPLHHFRLRTARAADRLRSRPLRPRIRATPQAPLRPPPLSL